jgi:hypothetical protein
MTDYPDLRSPALIRTLIIMFKNFLSAAQALLCTPGVGNPCVFHEVSRLSLSQTSKLVHQFLFCFTDRAAGMIS